MSSNLTAPTISFDFAFPRPDRSPAIRSCPRILAGIALAALSACVSPADREVAEGRARAQDAVNFFGQLCLSTLGERRAIEALLAQSTHPVTRLPDAAPAGARHRAAWSETGPHGARLILEVDDVQFCSVRVAEADGAALHRAMQATLDRLYGENGFRYRIVDDAVDEESGARRQDYLVRLPSAGSAGSIQSAAVAVASDTRRGSAPGSLTFGFSGAEF